MQDNGSDLEIHDQRNGIYQGGDEGVGHNCGVKSQSLSQDRQGTTDELGGDDRQHQSGTDHDGHIHRQPVKQHQFGKIGHGQSDAADGANGAGTEADEENEKMNHGWVPFGKSEFIYVIKIMITVYNLNVNKF